MSCAQAQGRCGGTVAVTMGARGFFWLDRGRVAHVPAFPVSPVDTNGAGDIFHGAYTVGLAEGRDVEGAAPQAKAPAGAPTSAPAGAAPRQAQTLAQMGIPDGSYDLVPLDGMRKTVARRFVGEYPRFRCRAVEGAAGAVWQDDEHFDLDWHVPLAALAAKGATPGSEKRALEKFVSQHFA